MGCASMYAPYLAWFYGLVKTREPEPAPVLGTQNCTHTHIHGGGFICFVFLFFSECICAGFGTYVIV